MKVKPVQQELFKDVDELLQNSKADSAKPTFSYARELRALGQAIEKKNLSSVALELQSGIYIVRGKIVAPGKSKSSLSSFVRDLVSRALSLPNVGAKNGEIDLRYTRDEIEKLDAEGRSKREHADRMPDPASLSQILRGAGAYLDHRAKTYLVGIGVKDRWVTIRHETDEGRIEEAKQDLEYFYDYWVKMYLRRSNRPGLPPPKDPSLIVTWQGIKKRDPTF